MRSFDKNSGFTLIELVLIIVIIGIVASVAIKSFGPAMDRSRDEATMKEMEALAQAIIGNKDLISDGVRVDFGYVGDIGAPPPNLDALVANPGGYSVWKGPYILNDFLENINDYKEDAWGNPYTFSGGVVITSSGNGSPITKQFAQDVSALTSNSVNGNISDGLGAIPGDSASNVTVTVFYPDGVGGSTFANINPSNTGQFSFSNMIPIGNHFVRAVYSTTDDTTSAFISVLPGNDSYCELRFSGAYW